MLGASAFSHHMKPAGNSHVFLSDPQQTKFDIILNGSDDSTFNIATFLDFIHS
jgi:hypothetical protein